jgi:hypothetical protein
VVQIVFPDALWDQPGIPSYTTTGHSSGFKPMDILTIDKTAGLLGVDLASLDAPWPSYMETTTFACSNGKKGKDCFPDQDGDGQPGITVQIQQTGTAPNPGYECPVGPWEYVPAPTGVPEAIGRIGAKEVHIGLRTKIGGSGAIKDDCISGAGVADVGNFESRALECIMSDGSACTASGIGFVDMNVPIFHPLQMGEAPPAMWKHSRPEADAVLDRKPSVGPRSAVVRLGDLGTNVSCADVRNAQYPALN